MLQGDFHLPKPKKKNVLALGFIGIAGLVGLAVTLAAAAFILSAWLGLPLNAFGLNEGPDQPIAFPHTVHVQKMGMDCTFCHRNVTKGAAASVPAVGLCMTCHKTMGSGLPEVEKLRDYHTAGRPIDWVRVHRVPDHAHFVHASHVRFFSERDGIAASRTCTLCHSDVGSMTKVKQVRPLKMGDCLDCHRDNNAPTDCSTCHY
mgnify:CR=1 FL=1